jgi:hypothetical protein
VANLRSKQVQLSPRCAAIAMLTQRIPHLVLSDTIYFFLPESFCVYISSFQLSCNLFEDSGYVLSLYTISKMLSTSHNHSPFFLLAYVHYTGGDSLCQF